MKYQVDATETSDADRGNVVEWIKLNIAHIVTVIISRRIPAAAHALYTEWAKK